MRLRGMRAMMLALVACGGLAVAGVVPAASAAAVAVAAGGPPVSNGGVYTLHNDSADTLELLAHNGTLGPITAVSPIAAHSTVQLDEPVGTSGAAGYNVVQDGTALPGYINVVLVTTSDGFDDAACYPQGTPSYVSCKGEDDTITVTVPPPAQISGRTENDTAGVLTLTNFAAPGGKFTQPPATSLQPLSGDSWSAGFSPAGGSVSLTYTIDSTHSVTFTDTTAGTGTCAIAPADPRYGCDVENLPGGPADVVTGPPPQEQVSGMTVNGSANVLTLTSSSVPGGKFTQPPATSLQPLSIDNWSAAVPAAAGTVSLTYTIDSTHSVTFTDTASGPGTCVITPADPGYKCSVEGTSLHPGNVLTGPPPGQSRGGPSTA